MSDQDFRPDKAQVGRSFAAAAESYDRVAVLQREVGDRLLERLEFMKIEPATVLDVGAGTGHGTLGLIKRYPKARVIALDLAPAMLRQARGRLPFWRKLPCVCGDAEALPLASQSVDLIFSNFTLQWCHDLDRVFSEFQRVLRPDGLLMFSTLGPDTLRELRQAWAAADSHTHVNAFIDMHDIGDGLIRAKFADPVMDVENFTLTYDAVPDLMRDLKLLGAHNVTAGRSRGLTGKGAFRRMIDSYETQRDGDGRLPASYEVVYGHAWAPHELPQKLEDGVVKVSLAGLRGSRRGG